MRMNRSLLLLVAVALLAACHKTTPAPPTARPHTATPAVTVPTATATARPLADQGDRSANVQQALALALLPEGVTIATVNGSDISVSTYKQLLGLRLYALSQDVRLDWSTAENKAQLRSIEKTVLDQLINIELVHQQAQEAGIELDPEQVHSLSDQVRGQLAGSLEEADWQAYKTAAGIGDETFERIIRESLLLQHLADRHIKLRDVEQVRAAHILVDDDKLADELLAQLDAGESFSELAKQHSQDPGSAPDGGDLGWFPRGAMVPEFEEAAFALAPGTVSRVVKTDYGYHIIKVLDRTIRPLQAPYDQMAKSEALNEWFDEVRRSASIVIYVPTEDN